MKQFVIALFVVALSTDAYSDCKDIVGFSKIRSDVVQDSSSLDKLARNFCSEYASSKTMNQSMKVDASYSLLSASLGHGSATAEQLASRYCDSAQVGKARTDAYRQYVESIAPGAFSAYERCESLRVSGISIDVANDAVLPKFFSASVSFRSDNQNASHTIDFTASPDVDCTWKNGAKGKSQTVLAANSSDALSCFRKSESHKSSVLIFPTSKPNSFLAFSWDAFQAEMPVDQLRRLTGRVDELVAALDAVSTAFRDGVLAFALDSCPVGWEEYEPAQGRFIRGIDRGGTDPSGKRTPGSIQEDELKSHDHSRPRDVFDAGSIGLGSVPHGGSYGYGTADTRGISTRGDNFKVNTGQTGGVETRPKNVALLYCRRK